MSEQRKLNFGLVRRLMEQAIPSWRRDPEDKFQYQKSKIVEALFESDVFNFQTFQERQGLFKNSSKYIKEKE